jgi:hypothetical protein
MAAMILTTHARARAGTRNFLSEPFVKASCPIAVFLGVLLGAAGLGGCRVGKGVGAASGTLFELGCSKAGDYCYAPDQCGTADLPVPFDLKPSFFAGEPIDDLRQVDPGSAIMSNRLTVRLQRSGKQIEQNDVLTFDIMTSYEVARCVRGAVDKNTGKNLWDENNCYRDPTNDSAPGRMRVNFDSPVHASLALMATCTANLVAAAVSFVPVPLNYTATPNPVVTDGSWASWVEFQEFGSASQVEVAPTKRDEIKNTFRIELGQRIYATKFALTLVDEADVNAAINNLPKPSSPEGKGNIGGTLGGSEITGRFDFDLERGQGAQFFP